MTRRHKQGVTQGDFSFVADQIPKQVKAANISARR
jgi:hypothetical protein